MTRQYIDDGRLDNNVAVTSTLVKRAFALAACALAAITLTACNTTEGIGKDIESAGDGIKDAARDAKN